MTELIALDGSALDNAVNALYARAKEEQEALHLDWKKKEEQEQEALIWVRMLELCSSLESRLHLVQGYVIQHIEDHDLLRYHPARSNWHSITEMIEDRMELTISASQRSDLAFITGEVIPRVREMGLLEAPSLSALRAMVPSLRIAIRKHDEDGIRQMLEQAAGISQSKALQLRAPEPAAVATVIAQSNGKLKIEMMLTPELFAKLRRSTHWVEFRYT